MTKIVFPIESTHILMFARAIGDENPAYRDPEMTRDGGTDGIIAPPTFLQAFLQFIPDSPVRPKPGEKWYGSGKAATGLDNRPASSGRLHAEQHFEYFHPVRAGDVLTVETKEGKVWEKDSKRAGKLVFSETLMEFHNQDDALVCVIRTIVMTPERVISAS